MSTIFSWLRSFWALQVMLAGGWVLLLMHFSFWIMDKMTSVLSSFQDQFAQIPDNLTVPEGLTNMLAICNTFLPLDTLFVYIIIYGGILVGTTVYRFLKTWLPEALGFGISGGA